jgi:drug/metabolite transporter (DMT)-like permease
VPVSAAYILVVLIWSTTPLGIVWSSESIDPALSLLMRMSIAVLLGWPLMKMMKVELAWTRSAVKVYLYSSMSLSVGMLFCYLAGRHISSGLMSLCFGVAPILSGMFAQRLIGESKFSRLKKVALLLALSGLALVCMENVTGGSSNVIGLAFIAVGVITFSLSGVMVKSVPVQLHPMSTTMGSLLVSMPLYLLFWFIVGGEMQPETWQMRSIIAVVYLGIFASLVGFLAYFFILQKLPATTVALVVMITPVLSTGLGILVNDEHFSFTLLAGGILVISGLALFQFGHKFKRRPDTELVVLAKR